MMEKLLCSREVADLLGVKVQTLRVWRVRGHGPPFVRLGGRYSRVAYRRQDIEVWVEKRVHHSTSEETVDANP